MGDLLNSTETFHRSRFDGRFHEFRRVFVGARTLNDSRSDGVRTDVVFAPLDSESLREVVNSRTSGSGV